MSSRRLEVLFTGYAPVHFLCFRPVFEYLAVVPDVRVAVSGGLRDKSGAEVTYDPRGLYGPLGLDASLVLTVDEIQDRHFDVLFAANTKMIAPGSVDTRIQIFHGVSFRNAAVRCENLGADYYFMVGPYMRQRFAAAGLIAEDDPRGVNIGFPKTDRLLHDDGARLRVCRRYGFDPQRPLVLYAPTGQRHNSLELFGLEVIEALNATGRYNLLVKLHDHPKAPSRDWVVALSELERPGFRLARELDVVPLLAAAELLITDASSVSNEYSLVDRPIVFLDTPKLIAKASAKEGSMVDLETWGRRGGPVVEGPDEIARVVEQSFVAPGRYSAVRRQMAKSLFYNPGRAPEAAVRFLRSGLPAAKRVGVG